MVKSEFSYKVTPIDVTGDDIPDGVLVQQTKNGNVVSSRFVSYDTMHKIADSLSEQNTATTSKKTATTSKKTAIYKDVNRVNMKIPNQLIVADNTSFAQSLKTGFATGLGREAASAAFDAVAGLFD